MDETLGLHLARTVFSGCEKKKKNPTNLHTWEALFTAEGSVLFTPNGLCEQKIAKVIWSESFSSASELNPLSHTHWEY